MKLNAHFAEIGIISFLPLTRKLHIWHDRKKYIKRPLFPSYIFVHLNEIANYFKVADTKGVLYFVKSGKEISVVSESIITGIKLLADYSENIEVSSTHFAPGQKVFISDGPLTGLSCEVIRIDNKQKMIVRVELLKRSLLVAFPEHHLVAK